MCLDAFFSHQQSSPTLASTLWGPPMLTWLCRIVAIIVVIFWCARAARAAAFALRDDPAAKAGPAVPVTLPPGVEDLTSILEPIRAKHKLPALGGAIVTSDALVGLGVTGVRSAGGTQRVTIDDQWHLGSCTKAMTDTLAAILVHKGTLRWGNHPRRSLPRSHPAHARGLPRRHPRTALL